MDNHLTVEYVKPEKALRNEPVPPLQPGWLVVYYDRNGVLYGGCDDREHGTVQRCEREGTAWTVHLTDGQQLPLQAIRGVAQTNDSGEVVAAWVVREHGFDGEGRRG